MTQQEFQTRYKYNPSTDCIGEGGFGKVYKAYDTHLDKWVAIKVAEVKPGLEQVRLKKEVEMVSKLPTHPNIANYEACYTFSSFTGDYDFAVLQYYEEGNLQQLMDSGKLNQTQKETLLRQILEGVGFLHNQEIIHRDLKPQNILIAKRNDEYIPKITDFGISKKLDINKSSVFTNSLAGAGTMDYASPEQLLGKTIKKNTDLWSFGVIAFQLLTGKLPFNTGNETVTSEAGRLELFKQITNGVVSESLNPISETWKNIISRCLATDNNARVQKISELVALPFNEHVTRKVYVEQESDFNTNTVQQSIPKNYSLKKKRNVVFAFLLIISVIIISVIILENRSNKLIESKELKFKNGLNVVLNKDIVTDVDGNTYRTVTIGTQTWLKEDLKTTRFRNGDEIPTTLFSNTIDDGFQAENPLNMDYSGDYYGKPTYQWKENSEVLKSYTGRYYTWHVVNDKRGIAPEGWRVPNSKDWQILVDLLVFNGYMKLNQDKLTYNAKSLWTKKPEDYLEPSNNDESVSVASCFSAETNRIYQYYIAVLEPHGIYQEKTIEGSKGLRSIVTPQAYWWLSNYNPTVIKIIGSELYLNESAQKYFDAYAIRCIKE